MAYQLILNAAISDDLLTKARVDPRTLTLTQQFLDPEIVQRYVDNGIDSGTSDPIMVVNYRDKLWVRNGHHRVTAALIRGEETIGVTIQNIDAEVKAAWPTN